MVFFGKKKIKKKERKKERKNQTKRSRQGGERGRGNNEKHANSTANKKCRGGGIIGGEGCGVE